jgi:hypothetical protein
MAGLNNLVSQKVQAGGPAAEVRLGAWQSVGHTRDFNWLLCIAHPVGLVGRP